MARAIDRGRRRFGGVGPLGPKASRKCFGLTVSPMSTPQTTPMCAVRPTVAAGSCRVTLACHESQGSLYQHVEKLANCQLVAELSADACRLAGSSDIAFLNGRAHIDGINSGEDTETGVELIRR